MTIFKNGFTNAFPNTYAIGTPEYVEYEVGYASYLSTLDKIDISYVTDDKSSVNEALLFLVKGSKKPRILDSVKVNNSDFNGETWDSIPFDKMPYWFVTMIELKKITLAKSMTDYAVFSVICFDNEKRRAEPGATIEIDINGDLHVEYY